jgi:hypothetical protein
VDLGEFAALLDRVAAELEDDAARECADRAGEEFLEHLKSNTPVLTGALRDSEKVDGTGGGGSSATVTISTHLPLYASFREYGGTIHVRHNYVDKRTGKTHPGFLSDGEHFFGRQVTQKGSGYMQRTVDWAQGGGIDGVISSVVTAILRQI